MAQSDEVHTTVLDYILELLFLRHPPSLQVLFQALEVLSADPYEAISSQRACLLKDQINHLAHLNTH